MKLNGKAQKEKAYTEKNIKTKEITNSLISRAFMMIVKLREMRE